MVDAAGVTTPIADGPMRLTPAVHTDQESAGIHAAACEGICPAPAQHPAWVSNWIRHSGTETFVAALHDENGRAVLSLPLEVVSSNSVKSARFMSGPHANGNFPAIAARAPAIAKADLARLADCISRARPDLDLLFLERQTDEIDGKRNPFLDFPHTASPNPVLAVSLEGGFDELLLRSSGKRKRKKHRAQRRKFEALGDWRHYRAETPDEVERLIEEFFAMKQERFRRLGIFNTFADEGVRRFFRTLFGEAVLQPEPSFVLDGLEVAGKLRAVTGSSIRANRIVCEFSSFADDEAAHASPGDFLFFENIRAACEAGMDVYDFSIGDEPYKRVWCDITEIHFDCAIPLTTKGRLAAIGYRAASEAKRLLKSNDALWRAAKKIRRSVSGG